MNCTDNHLPLEEHLRSMLRKEGPLVGVATVRVPDDTHTENAMACKYSHLTFVELLALCIGIDDDGLTAIRVKYINSVTPYLECNNREEDVTTIFRNCFAYDADLDTFAFVINQSAA